MSTPAPKSRPIASVRIGTPALVGAVVALSIPVGIATAAIAYPGPRHQTPWTSSPFPGAIDQVVIIGGNGNLDIDGSGDAGGEATVGQHTEWNGPADRQPVVSKRLDGGTLTLSYVCGTSTSAEGDCQVDWRIKVPAGVPVKAKVTNGNVTIENSSGALDVETTDGQIDGDGLGGGEAWLRTENGNIRARFTGAPKVIRANTANGNVDIATNGSDYVDFVTTRLGQTTTTNAGHANRDSAGQILVATETGNVTVTDRNF